MAVELHRPLEVLAMENKYLVAANEQIKNKIERLQGYIFSSQIRPILFGSSSDQIRSRTILALREEISIAGNLLGDISTKTSLFLMSLQKINPFSQVRHYHQTKAYLYSALQVQKKSASVLQDLEKIIVSMGQQRKPASLQALAGRMRKLFSNVLQLLQEDALYLQDFQGRYRIELYLHQNYESLLRQNILKWGAGWKYLKNGDIWVSFKTISFLKKEQVSHWITRFTGSQITHVSLFVYDSTKNPILIDSSLDTNYNFSPINLEPGVVFIVLRPKLSPEQRIQLWRIVREKLKLKIGFSKAKLLGVIPAILFSKVVHLFTPRAIQTRNILDTTTTRMFCSEFLNEVFKQVGFYLTPKSKYSSIVTPADIMASAQVEYVGLLFQDDEYTKEKIMKELVEGVRI